MADPAKQQPTLDQFTSRNPFIQATAAPGTHDHARAVALDVDFAHTPSRCRRTSPSRRARSERPTGTRGWATSCRRPARSSAIKSIASSGVTFKLLNGYTVGAGTNTKTFPVAEAAAPTQVTLVNGSTQKVYSVTVVQHQLRRESGSAARRPAPRAAPDRAARPTRSPGHSIKALSIETSNGMPSATITVDGTTFAARTVGQVTTTSWGQIKVVGINAPAQTVTILHADVQVTLHVGQSVAK